ncbi:unnamed protein product [Trichobilharzia regenti]|nr:unnamed protein product [Trichobilharzia regenti]
MGCNNSKAGEQIVESNEGDVQNENTEHEQSNRNFIVFDVHLDKCTSEGDKKDEANETAKLESKKPMVR